MTNQLGKLTGLPAALALLLATHALALADAAKPTKSRDLTVEQATLADIATPKSRLKIAAWLDRKSASYKAGDTVTLFIRTNLDAYLTVLDMGTSGKTHQLFPNAYAKDNKARAHQVMIVGGGVDYKIRVGGPAGREVLKIFATTSPEKIVPDTMLANRGAFPRLKGAAAAISRDLALEAVRQARKGGAVATKTLVLKITE